jgi:hypothetical protein
MRVIAVGVACFTVLSGAGCASGKIDIGGDTGGTGQTSSGGSGPAACSAGSGNAVTGGAGGVAGGAPAVTHLWVGYAEQTKFPSGSDQVVIRLTDDGGGTFEVGSAASLPPPTDPNVGYPSGFSLAAAANGWCTGPHEGFVYAFKNASLTELRLSFSVDLGQLWTGWCALQTPYPDATSLPGRYRCVPTGQGWGASANLDDCYLGPEADPTPIDCAKMFLCAPSTLCPGVCFCDACTCTSEIQTRNVDLVRNGNRLDGTLEQGFTMHLLEETQP